MGQSLIEMLSSGISIVILDINHRDDIVISGYQYQVNSDYDQHQGYALDEPTALESSELYGLTPTV